MNAANGGWIYIWWQNFLGQGKGLFHYTDTILSEFIDSDHNYPRTKNSYVKKICAEIVVCTVIILALLRNLPYPF